MNPIVLRGHFDHFEDERGYTNPNNIQELYSTFGLQEFNFEYQLLSSNTSSNVFRGFHFQKQPHHQVKILLIHHGSIQDIIFPIHPLKNKKLEMYELNAGDALLIPADYAHGYITKTEGVVLQYLMDKPYNAANYTGFYAKDLLKHFLQNQELVISEKDLLLPKLPGELISKLVE
jgi:dTDP-4-dehydrorhamnose 3,5-epimerase